MHLSLVVLRTKDMPELVKFYTTLGLLFEYHKHGKSPLHYSAMAGGVVIEIYPLAKDQEHADKNLRLGFVVDKFHNIVLSLKNNVVLEPVDTEWGYMAILQDPDGRKVEVYKQPL